MPTGDDSIRAVLFDLGGVLLHHADGIDHVAIELRFRLPPGTVRRCRDQDSRYAESRLGRCSHEEWLESVRIAFREALGWLGEAVYQAFLSADRPLNKELISLAEWLRLRYQTGIISNATAGLEGRFAEEFGIAHLFDIVVGSGDLGIAKPAPEIYLQAAERLSVPPSACVFIDDAQRNIDGAVAAGMKGLLFTSYDELVAELCSLGVEV